CRAGAIRLAPVDHPRDENLRRARRPLGPEDPDSHRVLRTGARVRDALSRLRPGSAAERVETKIEVMAGADRACVLVPMRFDIAECLTYPASSPAVGFSGCHGHRPSSSSAKLQLRKVRIVTTIPRTITPSTLGLNATVRMMSAATNTSSPSKMARPRSWRSWW